MSTIFCLNLILKWRYINIPLDRDYGIYGYHALFWLKNRKTPYRDTVEGHPPGRWLLYALLLKFFKQSRKLFRITNFGFILASNLLIYLICTISFNQTTALAAGIIFAIISSLPISVWPQSSDELYQIFFSILAFFIIIVTPPDQNWPILIAGLTVFLAVIFKQSAIINTLPVVALIILFKSVNYTWIILFGCGIIIGALLLLLFFLKEKIPVLHYRRLFALDQQSFLIHFKNLFYHTSSMKKSKEKLELNDKRNSGDRTNKPELHAETFSYDKRAHVSWVNNIIVKYFKQNLVSIILMLIGLLLSFNSDTFNSGMVSTLIWMIFIIFTIWLNKHLMPYHLMPLMAPLSIFAGRGVDQIFESGNGFAYAYISPVVLLIIFSAGIIILRNEIKIWIMEEKRGLGHIFCQGSDWEFSTAGEEIGKYLATVTSDDDQVYVWGPEHEIYIWAGRSSPTRTLFCPRSGVSYSPDPIGMETEIVNQLKSQPPKYIVITALLDENQLFSEFLSENYAPERKMYGEIEIHLRQELQEEKRVVAQIVQEPLVSIIILTWNALDYTRQCIDSIRANTNHPHEIIFVDNASTDGTVDYLNKLVTENENYSLIANSGNHGFAAGNNQGMAVARGNYLLLLNNDVLVPEGWLERLVHCAEMDSSIGLVGPLTNRISGLQMIENITYSDPADSFEYARRIAQAHQRKYTPRRRLAGFALLISRALYEQIGGLDERFGSGNYEDDDYCLRSTAAGFKIMVAEDVFIHHFGSVSFESNDIDYNRAMAKNRDLFRDKWPQVDLDWLMERDITLVELNDQIVERAQVALEKQKCTEAIELYQNILKTNPVDDRALYGMGLAYYMQSDNQRALEIFQRITNLIPEFSAVHANIGLIHAQRGDISLAVTSLNRVVELDPHNLDAQVQLAEILLLNDQVDSGAQVLKLVLETDPQHIGALNRMGILMLEINRKEKAQRYFEIALQLDPNNEMAKRHLTKINEL